MNAERDDRPNQLVGIAKYAAASPMAKARRITNRMFHGAYMNLPTGRS
jgi:hypothetical protein